MLGQFKYSTVFRHGPICCSLLGFILGKFNYWTVFWQDFRSESYTFLQYLFILLNPGTFIFLNGIKGILGLLNYWRTFGECVTCYMFPLCYLRKFIGFFEIIRTDNNVRGVVTVHCKGCLYGAIWNNHLWIAFFINSSKCFWRDVSIYISFTSRCTLWSQVFGPNFFHQNSVFGIG